MSIGFFEYRAEVAATRKHLSAAILQTYDFSIGDALRLREVDIIFNFTGRRFESKMEQKLVAMDYCKKDLIVEFAAHVQYHEEDVKSNLALFCFVKNDITYKVMITTMENELGNAKQSDVEDGTLQIKDVMEMMLVDRFPKSRPVDRYAAV